MLNKDILMLNSRRAASISLRAGLVLLLASALSCNWILDGHLNPKFCAAHPDDSECRQQYPDADTRCTASSQCQMPTGVCELPQGVCVQCTPDSHDACSGQTPLCNTDNTCHGCVAHSDCSSNVCLPTGACGDDTNVAYVDPTGTDNAMCTKAMPCTKVDKALATNRAYVKFKGTTDEAVTVKGARVVSFLADPLSELTRSTGNGAVVTVQDDGTSLSIYDLSISNAPNTPSGFGCLIPAGSGAPSLSLSHSKVINNPGGGVSVTGGALTISQSVITGNASVGVSVTGGTLTASQSMITGNAKGGISLSGAAFDLSNDIITGNGGANSTFGGVRISDLTADITKHRLEFNTIAYNLGPAVGGVNTGIDCQTVLAPVVVANSIVYGNVVSGGGVQLGGSANCSATYSDIGPDTLTGTGNLGQDPKFVNSASGDFHLQQGSPAQNTADPTSTTPIDFEGDGRPQGGRSDMGADEIK